MKGPRKVLLGKSDKARLWVVREAKCMMVTDQKEDVLLFKRRELGKTQTGRKLCPANYLGSVLESDFEKHFHLQRKLLGFPLVAGVFLPSQF